MTSWLPGGEIQVRGWSPDQCVGVIAERIAEVEAGDRPLLHVRRGTLVGKVLAGNRFSLRPRSSSAFGGAFVFDARAEDAPGGCVVRYASRLEPLSVVFWIGWFLAIIASLLLGVLNPEPRSYRPWVLVLILAAFIAITYRSLLDSRRSVHATRAELVGWLGDRVTSTTTR